MENKNVVRPAASTYALQFEADKNVKKLTVKYARERHCKNRSQPRLCGAFAALYAGFQTERAVVGCITSNITC